MEIRKRYIFIGLLILLPVLWLKSCEHREKQHWMLSFPPPIKMEKLLVYETGCDGFMACYGGIVVQMSEEDGKRIFEGGAEYLNSLPNRAVNGQRTIGNWTLIDQSNPPRAFFSSHTRSIHKTRLWDALESENCFKASLLYVCPESRIAYAGWAD